MRLALNPDEASLDLVPIALRWTAARMAQSLEGGQAYESEASDHVRDNSFILQHTSFFVARSTMNSPKLFATPVL